MADVVDRYVVVLAPKERDIRISLPLPKHLLRSSPALSLGHNPMLDSKILAGTGIRPPRNVTCGKDSRRTRLKEFVHDDAAVHFKTRAFRQLGPRTHADANDDEI